MIVLALDLGTSTGWAIAWPGDAIREHGTQSFATAGHERDGVRFQRFRAWLHEMKRTFDARQDPIARVVYERVDFIVPGQVYAAHCWGGFWAHLTAWCEHHQIDYEGIAVGTIKKAVAGNGRAKTPGVIAEVRRRGFKIGSLDEGMAIAVLLTAQALELERAA